MAQSSQKRKFIQLLFLKTKKAPKVFRCGAFLLRSFPFKLRLTDENERSHVSVRMPPSPPRLLLRTIKEVDKPKSSRVLIL
ncbi:hypothetical protein CH370_18185 [Leptospira kmetyi]|nr:hypothetical protein LEP1GSC052_2517 [Leptospira kmetyi serovar Malaysia str. Bejo-Iso9]PJZ40089.1 hypothetical protein CH370_18185 [Leptospira kmetyi]